MVKFGYGARGVLVAGILLGTSTGALAAGVAGENYFGIGYGFVTYDEVGAPEADLGALVGRFGHFFADNLSQSFSQMRLFSNGRVDMFHMAIAGWTG